VGPTVDEVDVVIRRDDLPPEAAKCPAFAELLAGVG
jgi:hypothetical protein